jgi:hypothetical protein
MFQLFFGFILGFCVATMGFTGVAQALDNGVEVIKNTNIKVEGKK